MTDQGLVREWTAEEAAEKSVQAGSVTPRVSRAAGPASGADHRPGVAAAADDQAPGQPADPPRGPAANAGVTP
jgi:hypothetical protein